MMLLAIDWTTVGVKVGQLLLSLSILVILHEFGHYITARWFRCRVEKFYLFFDPWFSLYKKKVGETTYGIGWLPLGGYVKIAGMIDESMDKEQMKKPPQSWEFRSKPAWQRLIIMIGGVTVNIILAFIIYAFVLMTWGDKKIPASSLKYGVHVVDSTLYKIGIRNGDKILAVDGEPVYDLEKIIRKIVIGKEITVERDSKQMSFMLPVNLIGQLVENRRRNRITLVEPRIPVIAYYVPDTSRAYHSGLRANDKIVAIDSSQIEYFDELRKILDEKKGQNVLVTVERDTGRVSFTAGINNLGQLGFVPYGWHDYQQMDSLGWAHIDVRKYSFFSAFPAGFKKAGEELSYYINQFGQIINPKTEGYKGIGGFKSMGSIFPGYWDWEAFWNITAFFSIILAFMNLLPIPALDGGHVLFTLIEIISGRKPNEKLLEYAQIAGMVLLFALLLYANGNDWFGWNK